MRSFITLFRTCVIAGLLLSLPATVLAQALTADYNFQNDYSSSVGGAPNLTDLISPSQTCPAYCNVFATETVLGASRTVLQFPYNNGVALSPTTSVLTDNGIYTIAILMKFAAVSGYQRIADFKNGTSDTGLYAYNDTLVLYPGAFGSLSSISAGTYFLAVLTRDAAGIVNGYVDGVQQFTFDDSVNQYARIDANNMLRFFQDNTSGSATGESGAGSVSHIRIFDGALTAAQVAALCEMTNYSVTTTTGASIVPGTNDIGNHCDDCDTAIMLPFPVMFYDQVFNSANVSSNGSLQFTSDNNGCCGFCIPDSSFNNIIAALASDLHTDGTNGEGATDGIFTSVSGSAPNRIFNIEWITFYHFDTSTTAHFEIRLYENRQRFDIVYGTISATRLGGVGVQRDTGSQFVTVSCDNGPAAGTQYTFQGCAAPPVAISTMASPTSNLGESISDTATVSGGTSPTGTVTFNIFGPNNSSCAGTPVFTSTVALDGNGQATSVPFKPVSPGTYYFVAIYNGDANNSSIASGCGDPNEVVVVSGNEVDGRGTLVVSGGQASFDLTVQNGKKGHHSFMYSDPASHLSFSSNKLSPVTIEGNHASFTGMAKMGKTKFNFTVDAYDNRPSGDQLFISTSNGYMAGGIIKSGDVEIHYDMPRR